MHVHSILIYLKNALEKLAQLLNVFPVTPWSQSNLIAAILWADHGDRTQIDPNLK